MSPDAPPPPGVAAERTALSWQRSCLSLIGVSVLVVRWSMVKHVTTWPGIVLTMLAAVGSFVIVGTRYRRICDRVDAGQTPRSRYLIPAITALVVVVVTSVGAGIIAECAAEL